MQIIVFARPEPPRNRFAQNHQQHPPFLRQQQLPRQGYAPPTPSDSYGEDSSMMEKLWKSQFN